MSFLVGNWATDIRSPGHRPVNQTGDRDIGPYIGLRTLRSDRRSLKSEGTGCGHAPPGYLEKGDFDISL